MNREFHLDGRPVIFDLDTALAGLAGDTVVGFDIETGGLNPFRDPVATVQLFGQQSGTLALLHVRGHLPDRLREFLGSPGRLFIGHNLAMFDVPFIATAGVDWHGARWYDSLIAETVITPGGRGNVRHSLAATLNRRLGVKLDKDIDHSWMNEELTEEQVYYAVRDVVHLPALREAQYKQAEKLGSTQALDMEMAMLPAVIQMRVRGMPISKPALLAYLDAQEQSYALNSQVAARVLRYPGLNPSSSKQVREALLGIGLTRLASTRDEVLASLIRDLHLHGEAGKRYAVGVQAIRDARSAKTRIGYYSGDFWDRFVEPDPEFPHFGWVRASLRPCGADTGRFTAANPNIQQVPVDMRHVFRAPPGWRVVTCDYSAIEVRVAAHIAKDEVMMEALRSEDIHTTVASLVFDVPYDEVTKDQRQMAKAMNFLLLFGGGVEGLHADILSSGVNVSRAEVQDIFSRYFTRFQGAWRMRERAQSIAHTQDQYWLEMPNGLKRLLVGNSLKSTVILNNTVQGTAGVGLKYALIDLVESGWYRYLGSTVHDEIILVVPEGQADEAAIELEAAMLRGMAKVIDTHVKVNSVVAGHWAKD